MALVDTYVDEHGTREVTQGFIDFLYTPEVQAIFAEDGFRPPVLSSQDQAMAEAEGTCRSGLKERLTQRASR